MYSAQFMNIYLVFLTLISMNLISLMLLQIQIQAMNKQQYIQVLFLSKETQRTLMQDFEQNPENEYEQAYGDEALYASLNEAFLTNSCIRPKQRFMLKVWVLEQMGKIRSLRQTYALSQKYLDLYLMKRNEPFPINQFQHLGIASWILGTKISGEKIPPINFSGYNQKEIWMLEKQLCVILDFKLHPRTYVSLVAQMTKIWDNFIEIFGLDRLYKYCDKSQNSVIKYQNVLNILDGIYLVPGSYEFTMQGLVISTFCLENYYQYLRTVAYGQRNQAFTFQSMRTEFKQIFKNFNSFLVKHSCSFRGHEINHRIISFVYPFCQKVDRERILTSQEVRMLPVLKHIQIIDRKICQTAKEIIRVNYM